MTLSVCLFVHEGGTLQELYNSAHGAGNWLVYIIIGAVSVCLSVCLSVRHAIDEMILDFFYVINQWDKLLAFI